MKSKVLAIALIAVLPLSSSFAALEPVQSKEVTFTAWVETKDASILPTASIEDIEEEKGMSCRTATAYISSEQVKQCKMCGKTPSDRITPRIITKFEGDCQFIFKS